MTAHAGSAQSPEPKAQSLKPALLTPGQTFASKLCPKKTRRRIPMAEVAQTRCALPQCTCPVQAREEYCSRACSDAAAEESAGNDRCTCPHPQCARAMAA